MGTAAAPITEDLRPILEEVRKELLDFGMRNPLLNYRLLKARGTESVPANASSIFRQLVVENQEFEFFSAHQMPRREQLLLADGEADSPSTEASWRQLPPEQQALWDSDNVPEGTFAAIHSEKGLESRLLATYYSARSSLQEQGINTLFIALGMLSWSEPAASEDIHRAPLLLVPVELSRESSSEGFRLRYSGDDVSPNVCLIEFLKRFGIAFDSANQSEEFDVEHYFDRFADAISANPTWSIDRHSVVLGFFSFSKFLMYRDLDPSTWPEHGALLKHGLLSKLLGQGSFAGDGSSLNETSYLDEHLSSSKCFQVVDADSSQTLALLDVANGKSMVIQGPPGTGKSQTIINIIAEAVANNKKVLFVSEKQAALRVVKDRLDKIGLGNPCLELHSNKAKKKEVIDELKRTAGLDLFVTRPRPADQEALSTSRHELNEYCRAVNEPIGASRERPIDLFGLILPAIARLSTVDKPLLDLPASLKWDEVETQRRRNLVKSLQDRLDATGIPKNHPYWGSNIRVVLPVTRDRLRHYCKQAAVAVAALKQSGYSLAGILEANQPTSPEDISSLCHVAKRLIDLTPLRALDIQSDLWVKEQAVILKAIEAGRRLSSIRAQWTSHLRTDAWSVDTCALRSELQTLGVKWWRFVSPKWKSTVQQVKSLLAAPSSRSIAEYLEITNAIQEASAAENILAEYTAVLIEAYGQYWRGKSSDWDLLQGQLESILAIKRDIASGLLQAWCSGFLAGAPDHIAVKTDTRSTEAALSHLDSSRKEVIELLKFSSEDLGIAGLTRPNRSLISIEESWLSLANDASSLDALVAYLLVREECRNEGLEAVTDLADEWESASACLLDVFDYARTSCLLDYAFERFPALVDFDQETHSATVDRFRRLDDKPLSWARAAVLSAHQEGTPQSNSNNGQLGYLRKMFERQTKFPAIRELMSNAGLAIQALKPVFMMSPLSVANFLPPCAVNFDLVIFDEASQVRPADALGAIVRGSQAVVVGDSKQLPPSNFFDSLIAADGDGDGDGIATTDIESILGLFCSRSAHQRMLRWHYRSKHESLIQCSNHLFYENKLVVFPSPEERNENLGLVYNKIANAPYERAHTRTNPTEARIIAEAVMMHAAEQLKRDPKERLTLGVAAFSVAQRDAILDQLEIARRAHPGLEEFFATPPHEPFFVKNLENIQGDERDVIFISVGYGRTAEGYLAMSFGPVNRDGGERRLNVLFTRARMRCEVFTTLSSDDIELGPTAGSGLRALKHFLQYAEHGRLGVATPSGREPDSPFEEQVIAALVGLGYEVHPQVGCAGFFIDMAVVDPNKPGRYLIGIECDGAAYHSARSARDRDRLRGYVLKGLGWNLHRIWSTAWFKSRDREVELLKAAIQSAQQAPLDTSRSREIEHEPTDLEPISESIPVAAEKNQKSSSAMVRPYEFCQLDISLTSNDLRLVPTIQLVEWITQVVAVESPVHWIEAGRRIADSLGVQRIGNRIQEALIRACQSGSRSKKFVYKDDFLFNMTQEHCPIRDRSAFPPQTKKLEYVSHLEICASVEHVVMEGFGMPHDDIPVAVCRLLGFARVSEEMRLVVSACRDSLISEGRLQQRSGMLVHQMMS
jgi:very-short-patch-repair endonuclease